MFKFGLQKLFNMISKFNAETSQYVIYCDNLNSYIKKDLEKLLLEGKIHLAPEMLVTGAKCDGSGEDYFKTEKSGVFGEVSYIPDCKMLGFMWTTNPRPICLVND